jgi:hypothetical protein
MSNNQRLIPLLKQLNSQNEQTIYDQIISLIENKNFDPEEIEEIQDLMEFGKDSYSPLMVLIDYLWIVSLRPQDLEKT